MIIKMPVIQILSKRETKFKLIWKAKMSSFIIKPKIKNQTFDQKLHFKGWQSP